MAQRYGRHNVTTSHSQQLSCCAPPGAPVPTSVKEREGGFKGPYDVTLAPMLYPNTDTLVANFG